VRPEVRADDPTLTRFAGLIPLILYMAEQLQIPAVLKRVVGYRGRARVHAPHVVLFAFVGAALAGIERLAHLDWLRDDIALVRYCRLAYWPVRKVLSNALAMVSDTLCNAGFTANDDPSWITMSANLDTALPSAGSSTDSASPPSSQDTTAYMNAGKPGRASRLSNALYAVFAPFWKLNVRHRSARVSVSALPSVASRHTSSRCGVTPLSRWLCPASRPSAFTSSADNTSSRVDAILLLFQRDTETSCSQLRFLGCSEDLRSRPSRPPSCRPRSFAPTVA